MMRLHSLRAVRTGLDGGAHALAVQGIADANDHENHLQSLRMIVNTDFYVVQLAFRHTDSETPLPMSRIVVSYPFAVSEI
jgi:hypothetical protein